MKIQARLDGSFDFVCLPLTMALMLGALGSLFNPAQPYPRGVVTVQALTVGEAGLLVNPAPVPAANPG